MNEVALIASLATLVSTMLGGLIAVRFRSRSGVILAFAAGVLLATPAFDLLPEAGKLAVTVNFSLVPILVIASIGFVFILSIERFQSRAQRARVQREDKPGIIGLLIGGEMIIHSFLEGVAIAIGFELGFEVGVVIAFAIIAHDSSDGFSTMTVMMNSNHSMKSSVGVLTLNSIAPFLGIASAAIVEIPIVFVVLLLPFIAGGFMCVSLLDLLPSANRKNPKWITVTFCCAGIVIISLIAGL